MCYINGVNGNPGLHLGFLTVLLLKVNLGDPGFLRRPGTSKCRSRTLSAAHAEQ